MNVAKTSILALLALSLLWSCGSDNDDEPGPPAPPEEETETVYFGVNLSGAEFASVYPGIDGTNYGYPGEKDFDYFKSKGLMMVRFPFRWERVQRTMNGPLVDAEIAKMKKVVQMAQDRGMKLVLDMHNFGRYCIGNGSSEAEFLRIGTPQVTVANYCDVWKKLAAEFKSYTCIWAYDIMNEPYDMLPSNPWHQIAQKCIDAIRTVDTKTRIMVSGNEFSSASRWPKVSDMLKDLVDAHQPLIFQAHTYFDKNSSGTYGSWVDGVFHPTTYEQEAATPQTGMVRVKPFVEWLKKNKLQGFVGEYGIPNNDIRWNTVLDNALKYLQENGVNGTYWSAGPRWPESEILNVQPTENYTKDRPQLRTLVEYKSATATIYKKTNP